MLSESQRLYLEEVLGTTPAAYRRAVAIAPVVEAEIEPSIDATIVVLTPPLSEAARALLLKILGSVKLADYVHVEGDTPVAAAHVLHFGVTATPGRSTTAHGLCWGFHDLERLLIVGDDTTRLKREVWTLLQAFAKEISC